MYNIKVSTEDKIKPYSPKKRINFIFSKSNYFISFIYEMHALLVYHIKLELLYALNVKYYKSIL